jgi:hypothetical protein
MAPRTKRVLQDGIKSGIGRPQALLRQRPAHLLPDGTDIVPGLAVLLPVPFVADPG